MPGSKQSHCKKGHPLSGDNLYENRGNRYCKACRAETNRRWLEGGCTPNELRTASSDKPAYHRRYEKANKQHRLELRTIRRHAIRDWYNEYKKDLSCVRCRENHPACITFHHINPADKDRDIASMLSDGVVKERILKEMEKCIVLCANCHAKEHWTNTRAFQRRKA